MYLGRKGVREMLSDDVSRKLFNSGYHHTTSEYVPSSRRNKIMGAVEYIKENYTSPTLTVEWLADYAGISTVHFRRIFERFYGTSPKKYIISLKLLRARELLSATDMKISEIADAVGFENAYYFSKLMREQSGMTPSEMRKKLTLT